MNAPKTNAAVLFGPAAALAVSFLMSVAGVAPLPGDRGAPQPSTTRQAGIRDLGTLGGEWSEANGVSDGGWIVGASQVAPGRRHATSRHAFLWRDGRMRDLGTLGGTESAAHDVNDAGRVVGVAQYDSVRAGDLIRRSRRAFLWEDGRMRGLGTLGGQHSEAHAINRDGWVVGRAQVAPGRRHSTSYHAFLWRDGTMRDLGTLGGTESVALDVNARGQVVGASVRDSVQSGDFVVRHRRAFLWQDGRMRSLGTLGGRESRAHAINGRGQVVGASTTRDGELHAFLWEDGEMRDLGTLGGRRSRAHDVDDAGRVVGASTTRSGELHAFLWVNGEMRDLGGLSDDSRASAISGAGLVVGASRTKRTRLGKVSVHAVAWDIGPGKPDETSRRRAPTYGAVAALASFSSPSSVSSVRCPRGERSGTRRLKTWHSVPSCRMKVRTPGADRAPRSPGRAGSDGTALIRQIRPDASRHERSPASRKSFRSPSSERSAVAAGMRNRETHCSRSSGS